MTNFFARQSGAYNNEMKRSLGALLGIAQGLICDGHLSNNEIIFLNEWLNNNDAIAASWPGDVIHARIRSVLADGIVTEPERDHLTETLQQLLGGSLDEIADSTHVTGLAFDKSAHVEFPEFRFCLTGDFVYATRGVCIDAIEKRGGIVINNITKKLRYLVIGGLGSKEWKHGSFGGKIEKAMEYKRNGLPILIVHEDQWTSSL